MRRVTVLAAVLSQLLVHDSLRRSSLDTSEPVQFSPAGGEAYSLVLIALPGRWYDRLAERAGQKVAGSVVLTLACVLWLVLARALGE